MKAAVALMGLFAGFFAAAADMPVDERLAAKAEVVLRARRVSVEGADKYAIFGVKVLQVLKQPASLQLTNELLVAAYSWRNGVPAGDSTLYLERYNPTNNGLWKLVGGEASTGVSHATTNTIASAFFNYVTPESVRMMAPRTGVLAARSPCSSYFTNANGTEFTIGDPSSGRQISQFIWSLNTGVSYRFPDAFVEFQKRDSNVR